MHNDGRADITIIPDNNHIDVRGAYHEAYKLHKEEESGGWLNSFTDVVCGFLFSDMKEEVNHK